MDSDAEYASLSCAQRGADVGGEIDVSLSRGFASVILPQWHAYRISPVFHAVETPSMGSPREHNRSR
jgi:hypothetical protein